MVWNHQGKTEQRKAAIKRRSDARALMRAGTSHGRGAMYLAGYAIECKIKAISMERHGCDTLGQLATKLGLEPRLVFDHGLEALIDRLLPVGTAARLVRGEAGSAFQGQVCRWTVQWRYDGSDEKPERVRAFLDAVDVVWNWLESSV